MADATETAEPLLSAKNRKTFKDPFMVNNPITLQVLGICSALAVTAQLKPSLVMGIAVVFVVAGANVTISVIRKFIPVRVRIIVEMTVVATLVILVDQVLRAYAFEVSKQLSLFVGLIITNCIVLGRLEAFAMGNKVWPSFLDGLGNGLSYAAVIAIVGFCREVMGFGQVFGFRVVPQALYDNLGYTNNGLMVLAPGAFIILGLLIWVQRTVSGHVED
ncbi:MAG: NADH:ubiquinone reductase (Na(+)-transporting) subunit D [Lentisphaeria bacterium]|jgi:Na+-transporting NADH:ubiquinone oxidoreductase subunit D|nr:NADH:ubiquinone reductase (Na(+)-transporting) subunit D [Lentisphaeria bacterium]MDP7740352.1 NADH:ubiquinone reductase (Na(+)-transporting) subunit D [Lentisphaeria bacterium]